VEVLAGVAADCAFAGVTCEKEIDARRKSRHEELLQLQEEQEGLRMRAADLQKRRDELRDEFNRKVWAVDEDLATVTTALDKASLRELALQSERDPELDDLRWEASTGEEASKKVAQQRRFLIEVGAASRDVEDTLGMRVERAERWSSGEVLIGGRPLPPMNTIVECENLHRQLLEELLIGLQATIRAPNIGTMIQDPAWNASMHTLHDRSLALLEQAEKELPQLLEGLHDDASGGKDVVGACFQSAAARYKEMRQELRSNLARLAKIRLSAAALPVVFGEASPPTAFLLEAAGA